MTNTIRIVQIAAIHMAISAKMSIPPINVCLCKKSEIYSSRKISLVRKRVSSVILGYPLIHRHFGISL